MSLLRTTLLIAAVALSGDATAFDRSADANAFGYGGAASARRGASSFEAGAYGSHGRAYGASSFVDWRGGGSRYGTSGTGGGGGSVVVIQSGVAPASEAGRAAYGDPGARRIDVAGTRLDRRAYDEHGLDIVRVGTAKIIRIAPGAARTARAPEKDEVELPELDGGLASLSPAERAVKVYPDPDAAPEAPPEIVPTQPPAEAPELTLRPGLGPGVASANRAPTFEPWTSEWLRDCVARYPDFDASLGTYPDDSGRRRFCTGETDAD